MEVSISEMRDFASGDDDFGNVINLSDMGDDLGASLLANTRVTPAPLSQSKSVSFDIGSGGSGGGGIEILEPLDSVNLDISLGDPLAPRSESRGGGPAIQINREDSFGIPAPAPAAASSSWNMDQFNSGTSETSVFRSDPEAEKKEKSDMINKLNRLEQKGYPVSRRFNMDNTLDEIKTEYNRLMDARQLETSIKFQRQMMMGLVTGVELLNEKFDPFDVQLKGWSESVHENIEDFDEVFEELYDKYKGKGSMPPEARLLMMLAGSGFMFHMSNSFFRSKMPSMNDIFASNPGLQRQFAAAAAAQVGPGFGNFMNATMPGPQTPGPEFYQAAPNPPTAAPSAPMPPTGMFYGASSASPQPVAAQGPPKAPRREMKGPSGVEDILKTFEEARKQESEPMFNPFGSGVSPNGSVMMSQGVSGFVNSGTADVQQPAISAIAEIQSLASEEIGSMAESRRGGARRRKAQPIGSTVQLDI